MLSDILSSDSRGQMSDFLLPERRGALANPPSRSVQGDPGGRTPFLHAWGPRGAAVPGSVPGSAPRWACGASGAGAVAHRPRGTSEARVRHDSRRSLGLPLAWESVPVEPTGVLEYPSPPLGSLVTWWCLS